MRPIDADVLKELIPTTFVDMFENCRNCSLLSEEQVMELIDMTPTVDMWIPCSERLPKIEREGQRRGWYITTNEYGSVGETRYEFYHDFLKTGWQTDLQIVAWMPLPEAYKGGKAND